MSRFEAKTGLSYICSHQYGRRNSHESNVFTGVVDLLVYPRMGNRKSPVVDMGLTAGLPLAFFKAG